METSTPETALNLLRCPSCQRGQLGRAPGQLECAECGRKYPVVDGIPNLVLTDSDAFNYGKWVEAQQHERAFWDYLKSREESFTSGPGHAFYVRGAEAAYAKFLEYRNGAPAEVCLEIGGGNAPRIAFVPAPFKFAIDPLMSYQAKLFPEPYREITCLDAMAERIPLPENSVDYVVMSNCLDHFAKPELALAEVFRVLKPEGLVFIGLETFTPLWKIWHKYRDKLHPYRWTADEQKDLVRRAGGKLVYFEVDPPLVQEWHKAVATTWRIRLGLLLKKIQESWIFAKKA